MIGNVRIKGSGHITCNTWNSCIDKQQVSARNYIYNVTADGVNVIREKRSINGLQALGMNPWPGCCCSPFTGSDSRCVLRCNIELCVLLCVCERGKDCMCMH